MSLTGHDTAKTLQTTKCLKPVPYVLSVYYVQHLFKDHARSKEERRVFTLLNPTSGRSVTLLWSCMVIQGAVNQHCWPKLPKRPIAGFAGMPLEPTCYCWEILSSLVTKSFNLRSAVVLYKIIIRLLNVRLAVYCGKEQLTSTDCERFSFLVFICISNSNWIANTA